MEKFVNKQTSISFSSQSSALSFHKHSHTISKTKPKVRIIHIFAPEIIKTDVANFRELVQRLTGKPTHDKGCRKNNPRREKRSSEELITVGGANPAAPGKKIMELRAGFLTREQSVIKEEDDDDDEEVMWITDNNGADDQSFLNGFGEFDGLIQELGHDDQFSFLPSLDASHLHGFEQAHQLSFNY